jgi:hypothetical protein
MPTYTFENKDTGEAFEVDMRIAELDQYKEDNPNLQQIIVRAPAVVGGLGSGGVKPGGGLDEVFAKAAEAHPDTPLGQRYGKKSIKDIKTKQVIEKHRKKWKSN